METVVPTQALLLKGVPVSVLVRFEKEWCEGFLDHSGDQNTDLHREEGFGIVQGLAVLTKVSAVVSEFMTYYFVARIGEVSFKRPIRIGETAKLTMTRLDESNRLTRLRLNVSCCNVDCLETIVVLANKQLLTRRK